MAAKIQIRRDTAANWTTTDPVLAIGEMGYETDTGKLKFGDGVTIWSSLNYFQGEGRYPIFYYFNDATADADPNTNNFSLNDSDLSLVTRCNISLTMNDTNISTLLSDLTEGSEIEFFDQDDSDNFIRFTLDSDVTVTASYAYAPVTVEAYGGSFTDGTKFMTNFDFAQAGSGGGHILQEQINGGTITGEIQQTKFLIKSSNGEEVLTNNATNGSTDYEPTIKGMNDIDATGRQAADVVQVNAGNDGHEYGATKDLPIKRTPFANITTSGQITGALHFAESDILVVSYETDANVTISIGWSGSATDIVNNQAITTGKGKFVLNNTYNETTNDKDIYLTFNSGTGTLSIKMTQLEGV